MRLKTETDVQKQHSSYSDILMAVPSLIAVRYKDNSTIINNDDKKYQM